MMRCLFLVHVLEFSGFARKLTLVIFDITTERTYVMHRPVVVLISLFTNVSPIDVASRHGWQKFAPLPGVNDHNLMQDLFIQRIIAR